MDLKEFASRFPDCRWLGDDRFQAHCSLPGHPSGDPEYSVLARVIDNQIKVACFSKLGHKSDKILAELGLTAADLRVMAQEMPHAGPGAAQDGFSANGAHYATGNGYANGSEAPKPEFGKWQLEVGYFIKRALDDIPEKERPTLAGYKPEVLIETIVNQAKESIAERKRPLWPVPEELSESELDEELYRLATAAVEVFQNAYRPEEEPPEEKISSLHLDQLYDMIDQWDRQPWVWEGILPHSSLSLIVGKSETGKSTLIYSLIYAIITGTDFFGRRCEQGRVVYLAGDPMSEVVAGKTFRALGLHDGVVVVPEALVMFPTGMEQLRALVQEFKPSLIVGDTLAATVSLDTDKYGESYRAQMPLTRMAREFGPNFLLSHHSQKSAIDSYSVIDAALGSVGVAAVASSRMGTKLYRRKGQKFYTFEMSNLRIGQPLEGEFIVHRLENGQVELGGLWKIQNTEMDKSAIIDVLSRQTDPMAKRTLWQELRPKPKWDAFQDAIEELFAAGQIVIRNGPRGGKLFELRGN